MNRGEREQEAWRTVNATFEEKEKAFKEKNEELREKSIRRTTEID